MATKKAAQMKHRSSGSSGGSAEGAAMKNPVETNVKWADTHLGRGGALVANGVFMAAKGATRVVGWTVGDANLDVKSGLRSLIPLHLRVSARVHHIAFYHPSFDAEIAVPVRAKTEREIGKTEKVGLAIKKTFGRGDRISGSDEADTAKLVAILDSEQNRLSRDGIVHQHMKREESKKRSILASQNKKSVKFSEAVFAAQNDDGGGTGSDVKRGARRFVMTSKIPQSAESKWSGEAAHEEIFRSFMKKRKVKVEDFRFAMGLSDDISKREKYLEGLNTANRSAKYGVEDPLKSIRARTFDADTTHDDTIVFDEDGVAGDGPALASLIKGTNAAKIGRFLPEVSCRVPSSSVGFELRNDKHRVQSTQPFVVEAPHVIWGGGRDRIFCRVAADGNPLIDARGLEYLSNNDLDLAERTESLMCTSATVWVDVPEDLRKGAKTAKDHARHAVKTMDEAKKKAAEVGSKSLEMAGKKVDSAAATGSKGVKKITKVFKFAPMRRKAKRTDEEGPKGEEVLADQADTAPDVVQNDEGFLDAEDRPSLERSPGKINLTGRKTIINYTEAVEESKSPDEGDDGKADLLPHPAPYILVLDDVLDFRVVGFPSSDVMASFPISVASVLNNRSMEDRLENPLRPSELTVTLVQEPSIKENRWGIEVKVTFRVAEVRPDTPLAVEIPELDEEGHWSKSNIDKKLQRLGIHLKNIGRSKEEIDKEIKAAKEREEAEEEALEEAIVAAGVGKGYEQGAPWKEIVRRQMFYDPEREAVRQKQRPFNSGDLETTVLKMVGLHSVRPDNSKDEMQTTFFDRLGSKIPSLIFAASDLEEFDTHPHDTSLSAEDELVTSTTESPNVATVRTTQGSDIVTTTEPSSSSGNFKSAAIMAEGGMPATPMKENSSYNISEGSQLFVSPREETPPTTYAHSASAAEGRMSLFADGEAKMPPRESSSLVKTGSLSSSAAKPLQVDTLDLESDRGVGISTRASSSDSTEQSAVFQSAVHSIVPDLDDSDVFQSTVSTIKMDSSLSGAASKRLQVDTSVPESDRIDSISTRITPSDSTEQSALFKSAVQYIKPDLGDMDALPSTKSALGVDMKAMEEVATQGVVASGKTARVEDELKSTEQHALTPLKAHDFEIHRKVQDEGQSQAEEEPSTKDVKKPLPTRAKAASTPGNFSDITLGTSNRFNSNTSPKENDYTRLSSENVQGASLTSALENSMQTEAAPGSKSFSDTTVETLDRLKPNMSLKEDDYVQGRTNVLRGRKLSTKQRRRDTRSSILMQLSLGGIKGLVGEDELNMLRQIASIGEEESSGDSGKRAEESSAIGDITALDRRPGEGLASCAFAFTEHCKHILLEEYPGLLLGLCAVIFVLVIRWTLFL